MNQDGGDYEVEVSDGNDCEVNPGVSGSDIHRDLVNYIECNSKETTSVRITAAGNNQMTFNKIVILSDDLCGDRVTNLY